MNVPVPESQRPDAAAPPLRIAYVVSQFPAQSETFVAAQVAGMHARGHTVDVYTDEVGSADFALHPGAPGGAPPNILRPLRRGAAVRALAGRGEPGLVARIAGMRSWMRSLRYGAVPAVTTFRYAAAARFRTAEYDIIHAHFGPNGVKASAMRAAGVFRGRLVVTFHGHDMSQLLIERGRDEYARLFDSVDLCLPVTDRWRERLIELGCDPKRIRVQRMGVDLDRFTCPPRDRTGATPHVVTVARLVEKKGVEYAIRAAARVDRAFRYTIVGGGPERDALERLVRELGLDARVRLVGWLAPADVRALLCDADIALLPSVTSRAGDQEGLPVALMEAMAAGLPVVSTHHSGIPELVEDGVTGFLVAERDVDALAERIAQLLDEPELRRTMGRSGRERVAAQHDDAMLNDRLVELYRATLRGA